MLLMWTYFGFVIVGLTGTATSAASLIMLAVKLGLAGALAVRALRSLAEWCKKRHGLAMRRLRPDADGRRANAVARVRL